jgi:hypothetical protein
MRRLSLTLLLAVLIVATPVFALPDDAPEDEGQQSQTLLRRWRTDAEHYARLKRNLKAFKELPADRQERLRALDRDVHEEEPAIQAKLWRVLDRYTAWLERLPAADQERIRSAATAQQRLQVVREIRERQWIERLPAARRKEIVDAITPEKRAERIARVREEEQKRRLAWQKVLAPREDGPRRGPPVTVAELPLDLKQFVEGKLLPVLKVEDRKRLAEVEGKWPAFGIVLRELFEKYPVTLPGPASSLVLTPRDLPPAVRMKFQQVKGPDRRKITFTEGKWPDFAVAVTEVLRRVAPPMPEELGPCRPGQFSPEQHEFIEKKLLPALGPDEKLELRNAEGMWPEYPQAVQRLALKHELSIPNMPLPGPPDFWERLKVATTDVPVKWLQEFARDELTREEREQLRLKFDDPESLQRLKELFLKRKPGAMFQMGPRERPRLPRKDAGIR